MARGAGGVSRLATSTAALCVLRGDSSALCVLAQLASLWWRLRAGESLYSSHRTRMYATGMCATLPAPRYTVHGRTLPWPGAPQ